MALLSSGDELLPAEAALEPGNPLTSNSYMLSAYDRRKLARRNYPPLGIAADRFEAVSALLEAAANENAGPYTFLGRRERWGL